MYNVEKSKVEADGGEMWGLCLESVCLRERLNLSIRSLTSAERSINHVGGGDSHALVKGSFQSSFTNGIQALKQRLRNRDSG